MHSSCSVVSTLEARVAPLSAFGCLFCVLLDRVSCADGLHKVQIIFAVKQTWTALKKYRKTSSVPQQEDKVNIMFATVKQERKVCSCVCKYKIYGPKSFIELTHCACDRRCRGELATHVVRVRLHLNTSSTSWRDVKRSFSSGSSPTHFCAAYSCHRTHGKSIMTSKQSHVSTGGCVRFVLSPFQVHEFPITTFKIKAKTSEPNPVLAKSSRI